MGGWAKIAGGVWVTLILLGVIARILRPFLGPSPQGALLPGISQDNLGFIDNTQQSQAPARRNLGPPTFSEPNGWRNLVGGVRLTTIRIGGGPGPGRSGKLLVYLPAGVEFPGGPQAAQEGTYPCILITSAGTGLFHGISWDPEEEQVGSPEHLPWAKAGYVVVAFEEDGPLASDSPSNQEMQRAILAFHNAKAGIINGQTALNFVEQKLPCVDKRRVFAVGHSSTGTLALILAANDERVQGVAAFAPAINLETRFPADLIQGLRQAGVSDLATDYSPHTNEGKLRNKPVFLFHALDDSNVKVAESQAAEARMKAIGVPVTLMVVPNGNHYDSMIREGIPSAISFFSKMR